MWHRVAEVLGRSVWEAKLAVDLQEFISWIAYFELKHEYEAAAAKGEKPRPPPPEEPPRGGKPSPQGSLPPHVPTKTYKKKVPLPEF